MMTGTERDKAERERQIAPKIAPAIGIEHKIADDSTRC